MAELYWIGGTSTQSWATALNWHTGAVPVNSDNVTLANATSTISAGLNQAAVTVANLNVPLSFTGTVGMALQSTKSMTAVSSGTTATATVAATHGLSTGDVVDISGAVESAYNGTFTVTVTNSTVFTYTMGSDPADTATGTIVMRKTSELHLGVTAFRYGEAGQGTTLSAGSGRFNINLGSAQNTTVVLSTGTADSSDTGLEPLRIRGTHSSNKLYVHGGLVGVATSLPSEVATFSEINCLGSDATINVGGGVTLATVRQTAGLMNVRCAMTTVHQDGGEIVVIGTGAITTANIAGKGVFRSTGTITTLNLFEGGYADFLQDYRTHTVTTINMYKGSRLEYDPAVLTVTNPINLIGCSIDDVDVVVPSGHTMALVAS